MADASVVFLTLLGALHGKHVSLFPSAALEMILVETAQGLFQDLLGVL